MNYLDKQSGRQIVKYLESGSTFNNGVDLGRELVPPPEDQFSDGGKDFVAIDDPKVPLAQMVRFPT